MFTLLFPGWNSHQDAGSQMNLVLGDIDVVIPNWVKDCEHAGYSLDQKMCQQLVFAICSNLTPEGLATRNRNIITITLTHNNYKIKQFEPWMC